MDNYKIKTKQPEKNASSLSNEKTFGACDKHPSSEGYSNQQLKNYIDCNNEGMIYDENMKNHNS